MLENACLALRALLRCCSAALLLCPPATCARSTPVQKHHLTTPDHNTRQNTHYIKTKRYEALKHVSFAVQTLGKCAKMFPVMLWGALILRKSYKARDYLLASAVAGGCFVFFTAGPTASRLAAKAAARGAGGGAAAYGAALMAGYLAADGYT